jgi:hypothetical protein
MKVAKQVPDLVAEDYLFYLQMGNQDVDCEAGRFFY